MDCWLSDERFVQFPYSIIYFRDFVLFLYVTPCFRVSLCYIVRIWGYLESLMVRFHCAGVLFLNFRFQNVDIREYIDRKDHNS